MVAQPIVHCSSGRLLATVFVTIYAWSSLALAQTETIDYGPSSIDVYGNAWRRDVDRRPTSMFQNDLQRQLAWGYQTLGRRTGQQRMGSVSYALPGYTSAGSPPQISDLQSVLTRPRPRPQGTSSIAGWSSRLRVAFSRYGGFGRRSSSTGPADLSAVFRRQHELVGATALNAPVYRAMLDSTGAIARPAASGAALPFPNTEAGVPAGTIDLGQRLEQSAEHAHLQAKVDGWTWFRQGRYHRAARAFESATLLDSQDSEARIGQIFSYLAVGAGRTALAVLGELNRRDANPFVHQLNLADPGGDHAALREIRLRLRARAQADNSNPDITALYALVLWHLGDKEEATLTASNLARSFPGSGYADWPARMDAARKTPPADKDRT